MLRHAWSAAVRSLKVLLAVSLCLSPQLGFGQTEPPSFVVGIHAHHVESLPQAAAAGAQALRLWDTGTSWRDLEASPGRFDFRRLDAWVEAAEALRLPAVLTLGCTPVWAAARKEEPSVYGPGCASEPDNIGAWRLYVRTVADRYRGRIECYEVWNEVSFPRDPVFAPGSGGDAGQFFSGTVQDLVALTRSAAEEIRRADPKACVLSPSFHSSGDMLAKLDRFLAAGGGADVDRISFHFYFLRQPEETVALIRGVRNVLREHGLETRALWDTEVGGGFAQQSPASVGPAGDDWVYAILLRTALIDFSEGIGRVYWYAWDNAVTGFGGSGGAAARDGYSAVIGLLHGLQRATCSDQDGLWRCRLHFDGHDLVAVWQAASTVHREVRLPKGGSSWGRNPTQYGADARVTLSERPILISMTAGEAEEAVLRPLRTHS